MAAHMQLAMKDLPFLYGFHSLCHREMLCLKMSLQNEVSDTYSRGCTIVEGTIYPINSLRKPQEDISVNVSGKYRMTCANDPTNRMT